MILWGILTSVTDTKWPNEAIFFGAVQHSKPRQFHNLFINWLYIVNSITRHGGYDSERQLMDGFRTLMENAPFRRALSDTG